MQNKGAIRLVAILIALACIYQLSFTWATRNQESKAKEYAANAVKLEQTSPSFKLVSDLDKAFYLDSLNRVKERYYIDSITAEKVYLGFTYKEIKEKEINLGLDLKGGMNVMLEVSVPELVTSLSNNSTNPQFLEAIKVAKSNLSPARTDFIVLFGEAWDQVAPGQRMSQVFGTYEMRDRIKPETSNTEILDIIREESESAISNSFNVLRNRIRRFGVTQPNIQKIGTTGRILVELPGVKEPARVRKLLQGTASLEFWETYENQEVYTYLTEANRAVKEMIDAAKEPDGTVDSTTMAAVADSAKTEADKLLTQIQSTDSLSGADAQLAEQNPLFFALNPNVAQGQLVPGPCVGRAHYRDTAKIGAWLRSSQIEALFPADLKLMWTVKPIDDAGVIFELVAIKATTRDGKAPLDGGVVTDANKSFGNTSGTPEVDMAMNAEGARIWANMTANNIGRCIAIVLDGMVYSYPRVNSEITGGRSQISGNFTITEADDLANVLKSGKLPAPARIVQEAVVGPSLGSESINAGLISFVIAFLLVLVYMIAFYNGAGLVANIALLTNVLFLFGALVSFGEVLTLPGIAGIVLTLGMAVDANVIIYERIREEIRGGKALRLAVTDGYKNAYSAIVDGNLTTIITGVVLAIFGSGPVQGFATTLVIGIITSLITSIFITRLVFDWRLNKNKNITFDNKYTRNFLQNTKVDFVGLRKKAYMFSIAVTIIGLGFIFVKGFSYGVDFTGGRTYVIRFDKEVTTAEARTALLEEFEGSVEVKQFGGGSQMKVTTKYMIDDNSEETDALVDSKVYNALKGLFAQELTLEEFTATTDNPNGIVSSEKVGPTIADDIKRDAFIAVIIALIAIFVYIASRFRNWTWGTGGVVALTHDAIFVMSFFAIFTGLLPFSLDVDQSFIAAILTIIGYSINDTVIIFDRIREFRTLYPKRDLKENINDALNSTLSRTVNTGGTTLVVLISIALFGGEVIRGFSVALIIGVIIGTYSSVFIATPLVYDLYNKINSKKSEIKSR
ncbi:MAG TPA: protein translocase subunit SecDF [Rikenellaceae bacterium]|jgi:SecD/SecF fusion protein|nr:MAG: protein translocase subunit SecDF [Bacteroidetes bacterium GWE2_40_15]PKP07231.1 MAG: protein translocase subunit SecDF [Bacteroidetes bacterium HGW-Bacteroidetes-5]HBZ24612.1 protein translocase subunit SecDF [Rikenellaceae bacterium]